MVSVTSDVTASASYQSAPPRAADKAADKAALPDASQLASNFASLVNNNLPSASSNLLPPAQEPPPPPPPQRSANDNSSASRNTSSNNNSQASSAASQNQPNDPPANNNNDPGSSQPTANNGNNNNDGSSSATQASGSSTKSDSSKSSNTSQADKSSTDPSQSTDASAGATAVDPTLLVQNPVAVVIPVTTGLANSPSTPSNSGGPLSIAAAAIATAASTTSALAGASTPTATGTTSSPKTADAATTKTQGQTQAPTTGTAAAPQLAGGTATSAELALATAAGVPGMTGDAKTTGSKTTTATAGKAATTTSGGTTATTDPSATANQAATGATPQPTVDAKADATSTLGNAIKPDGSAASTPATASTTGHDHSVAAGNDQAPATSVDANAQAFVLPQQQLSGAASVTGTDKLTATQATGSAVPLSGLAIEIASSVQSGKTRFEVRLDPADLGRIDVRIDVDRNGQVTSHLTVEKPETLSMLRQDAPQLQQALNDAGLKTGSGGLQFSLRDQSSSGQNSNYNQSGGQPQRLVISEDDSVPATVARRSYGRMLGASGGVDISV